ncbi:MAG: PadR family transcriptional regulator [Nocardioidaceae bacterium]
MARHGHRGWDQGWSGGWSGSGQPWRQGPPPWVQGLIGMAQAGAQARGGPKVRRGDVRAAILDVLSTGPMNGYQIIQAIAERSGGVWKPSPGSVYPTVQQLEDEGLVEGVSEPGGRRVLQLSEAGKEYVVAHVEELAETWRPFGQDEDPAGETNDLKPVVGQVMAAVWQVMVSGTRQQQAEAAEILADARRRLYGLLADGDPESAR